MADYSLLLLDPFAPETLKTLEEFEEFQFDAVDKKKVVAYIVIMYDIKSDMKKLYPDNLYERKQKSAVAAGFKITDGKFDPWVEAMLVGENDEFNEAVLRFVRMFSKPDLPAYIAYTEILYKQVIAAMRETNASKLKVIQMNIESSRKMVASLERGIFSGDEVENVRAALYRLAESQRLLLRPEDKAREIDAKTLTMTDPHYPKKKKKKNA